MALYENDRTITYIYHCIIFSWCKCKKFPSDSIPILFHTVNKQTHNILVASFSCIRHVKVIHCGLDCRLWQLHCKPIYWFQFILLIQSYCKNDTIFFYQMHVRCMPDAIHSGYHEPPLNFIALCPIEYDIIVRAALKQCT